VVLSPLLNRTHQLTLLPCLPPFFSNRHFAVYSALCSSFTVGSNPDGIGRPPEVRLPQAHPLSELWTSCWKSSSCQLFKDVDVERDHPKTTIETPEKFLLLDSGSWVKALDATYKCRGIMVREEYQNAMAAMVRIYQGEILEILTEDGVGHTLNAGAKANPFYGLNDSTTEKGFVVIGQPGIGRDHHSCIESFLTCDKGNHFYYMLSLFTASKPA
jgi:hypothetical protein